MVTSWTWTLISEKRANLLSHGYCDVFEIAVESYASLTFLVPPDLLLQVLPMLA